MNAGITYQDDNRIAFEPSVKYDGKDYPLQEETYSILGKCFEVHKILGHGFLEAVYKDALCIEFRHSGIPFEKEKKYKVVYKGEVLNRFYKAGHELPGRIEVQNCATCEFRREIPEI